MQRSGKLEKPILRMSILFIAPALVIYLIFFIYPAIKALYVSLFDWNGFTSSMKFIGLSNFKELIGDRSFWNVAVKNQLLITFVGGFIIFLLAFILCGFLSTNIKGKKLFRALIFFPSIVSPIAIAILWTFMYNKKWGLLNAILKIFGLKSITWMNPSTLIWAIIAVMVWMYMGYYCVILLAGLDQVPQDYIEAATLDGANQVQIFFRIKLPLIWDVLVTAISLWGINSIKDFALLYAWGGGIDIPPDGATNMAVKMYITAFGKRITIYRMGYSTAMGVVMFLAILLLTGLINFLKKRSRYSD